MCGIIGYVGKNKCKKTILDGLTRLEYRGYDSAGFVIVDEKHKHLCFHKEVGQISSLKKILDKKTNDGFIGMGHTRWATHGVANQINAHPQLNSINSIAVVHNGIIEGHNEIKNKLIGLGHEFRSTTDTEVVIHLLEETLQNTNSLKEAIIELTKQLSGVYALVFLLEKYPDRLVLVRHKSPLAIGIGNGEMFVSSDPVSFAGKTKKVIFLPENSFAFLKKDYIELYNFEGEALPVKTKNMDFKFQAANKDGFEHFMLKEIYEQKKSIDKTISFYKMIGNELNNAQIWDQLGLKPKTVKDIKSIHMVAAGTSWHSGKIAQFFFEKICNIPSHVHLASEFRYKKFFPEKNSIFIMISQSGETADTLECLRHVNSYKIPTIALTNVPSSTMVREAGGFLLMQAGPEISVASTKAFTAQLASLYWLANLIALEQGKITTKDMKTAEEDLLVSAEILESSIENYKWDIINKFAPKYSQYERFIFLGRNITYPLAQESALKLKEISYRFAQSYPAGELKHGPIALVDKKTPVIIFSLLNKLIYQKLLSNAQEVKARHGHIVSFAFEGQDELIELSDLAFVFPKVNPLLAPIGMAGLMQFFVYSISKELGTPIDKPRNLAKSVTVE